MHHHDHHHDMFMYADTDIPEDPHHVMTPLKYTDVAKTLVLVDGKLRWVSITDILKTAGVDLDKFQNIDLLTDYGTPNDGDGLIYTTEKGIHWEHVDVTEEVMATSDEMFTYINNS